jgi:hypothetical protein
MTHHPTLAAALGAPFDFKSKSECVVACGMVEADIVTLARFVDGDCARRALDVRVEHEPRRRLQDCHPRVDLSALTRTTAEAGACCIVNATRAHLDAMRGVHLITEKIAPAACVLTKRLVRTMPVTPSPRRARRPTRRCWASAARARCSRERARLPTTAARRQLSQHRRPLRPAAAKGVRRSIAPHRHQRALLPLA